MQRWAQKWYGPNREENIKKGWQQYTEELYKRDLNDQDNHDGVITRQSQTSWNAKSSGPQEASLQTKLVGGDGIPVELFQILKDDAVKVLHLICQQI